ncbi:MAG: hypothetical protein KGI89_04340 [Euryarchaeota archaeon]|nr:hypothetical protein [Euryarchaeota archaeon]
MVVGDGEAVVLWTGGKDSALALFEERERGAGIRGLVTFAPPTGEFKAHAPSLIRAQAESLRLPHRFVAISPPYAEAYEQALRELRAGGVRFLITGDISEVQGHEGWLEGRAKAAGLELVRPLWERGRRALLERMLEVGLRPVITALRTPVLPDAWVGRSLDRAAVEELAALPPDHTIDLCGEGGEYHTMTLGGPGFQRPLSLGNWTLAREGDLRYARLETSPRSLHRSPD